LTETFLFYSGLI